MRLPARLGMLILSFGTAASAQAGFQAGCAASGKLMEASHSVAAARGTLEKIAVAHDDPAVPLQARAALQRWKDDLEAAAVATFACALPSATQGQLQDRLAQATHANTAADSEVAETGGKRDLGAYGSDLAVQVFQLFGRPKLFEVDFRYGIECGDDNLILLFEAADEHATDGWHLRLRWDAADYNTVGDAFGDFLLLTPLTGSYQHPVWRYLVAHGHPSCGTTPRTSHFDLDLLRPSAQPEKPMVDWHFSAAYSQGDTTPRLATTEDTIDLQFEQATPAHSAGATGDQHTAHPSGEQVPHGSQASTQNRYRFRLRDGHVEQVNSGDPSDPAAEVPSTALQTDAH